MLSKCMKHILMVTEVRADSSASDNPKRSVLFIFESL